MIAFMYVGNCIYTSNIPSLRLKYLHAVDVNPAHAAAAVNEEDKLAVNLPQVWADRLEVGAKVQHDHRVVEDVLMESSVNDIYLEMNKKSRAFGTMRWVDFLGICEGFDVTLQEGKKKTTELIRWVDRAYQLLQMQEIPGRVWWAIGVFP